MIRCYIGIGSNLGNRRKYIDDAIQALRDSPDIKVGRISSIYETEPLGAPPQGKYLNGVIEIATGLEPKKLLRKLNRIETLLGRVRTLKNAPRTIDLDILFYGNTSFKDDELTIPHPKIDEREFVLKGLRELGKA